MAATQRWSTRWSIRSAWSVASIDSLSSAGSIRSLASFGSVLSIGSSGSILSIGSAGSILSIGSVGSILGHRTDGAILHRDGGRMTTSETGVHVATLAAAGTATAILVAAALRAAPKYTA